MNFKKSGSEKIISADEYLKLSPDLRSLFHPTNEDPTHELTPGFEDYDRDEDEDADLLLEIGSAIISGVVNAAIAESVSGADDSPVSDPAPDFQGFGGGSGGGGGAEGEF